MNIHAAKGLGRAAKFARRLQGGEPFSSYTGLASLILGRVERDAGHADQALVSAAKHQRRRGQLLRDQLALHAHRLIA